MDDLVEGNYSDIRTELPNVKIVQVLHVEDEKAMIKHWKFQIMLMLFYWIQGIRN